MKIEIQKSGLSCDQNLQHFVKLRSDLALHALRDQIRLINIFIDSNRQFDGKGEIRCLVLIKLGTEPDLVVETTDSNLYLAIHRAIDDAGWKLAEVLSNQQTDLLSYQIKLIHQPSKTRRLS